MTLNRPQAIAGVAIAATICAIAGTILNESVTPTQSKAYQSTDLPLGYITADQQSRLSYLAWPQSVSAMRGFLGRPRYEEGPIDAYIREDGAEVHIRYNGTQATGVD